MVHELQVAGLHLEDNEAETVKLLLSELLANAITHGFGGEVEDPGVQLTVNAELQRDTGRLRVSVADPAADVLPKLRNAGADSTNGRGLLLITLYSADFGWDVRAGAKTTWFELALAIQDRPDDEAAEDPVVLTGTDQRELTAQRVAVLDAHRRARDSRPAPWIGTIGSRQRDVIGVGGAAA
jgi:anti-sigma regulatory factor (Ser/Thr protein kinase)